MNSEKKVVIFSMEFLVRIVNSPSTLFPIACMDLSRVLSTAQTGEPQARAELIQAAYQQLRRLAAGKMAGERQDHTLTSTALVHEVSVRMLTDSQVPTENWAQFFAYASTAMRNLLVDHARARGRQKRGGDRQKFSFDEAMIACNEQRDDFIALNDALQKLADLEPRKAQVVEMRYFGGMSIQEVASALDISVATVSRDWVVAQGWLLCELRQPEASDEGEAVE